MYGRNHAPEDIEATISGISRGRCVAIAVPRDGMEELVAIIEVKTGGEPDEDALEKFALVKRQLTAAISNAHGLSVADLVLVPQGSIPITTSGKVRRSTCVEQYQRVNSPALTPSRQPRHWGRKPGILQRDRATSTIAEVIWAIWSGWQM